MKKILFLLLLSATMFGQHTLTGNFTVEDGYQFGILYRITPENVFYVTDANMNTEGVLELPLSAKLKPGMYRLVYNLPQDQYFFDFIYDGKEDITFNFSEEEFQTYPEGSVNNLWTEYRRQLEEYESGIAGLMTSSKLEQKELQEMISEQKNWYNTTEKAALGSFSQLFIKATKPYLETDFKSVEAYNDKSKEQLLSAIPFSNPLVQNSAIPLEQSLKYIYNYVDQDDLTKSRENNIDDVAEALKDVDKTFQKNLLNNIYNFLVNGGQVNEANYLAEKHLIPVARSTNDNELVKRLKLFKNLSLGEKAPNFDWTIKENGKEKSQSLRNLEGYDNYIIVFWSSLCSHCLKEVPLLHKKIEGIENGKIKVIAVGLEDFEQEWAPKAAEFPQFINVLGLGKWENEIGNNYDVSATPSYFFLDKDKKIKSKPETLEGLFSLIDVSLE